MFAPKWSCTPNSSQNVSFANLLWRFLSKLANQHCNCFLYFVFSHTTRSLVFFAPSAPFLNQLRCFRQKGSAPHTICNAPSNVHLFHKLLCVSILLSSTRAATRNVAVFPDGTTRVFTCVCEPNELHLVLPTQDVVVFTPGSIFAPKPNVELRS